MYTVSHLSQAIANAQVGLQSSIIDVQCMKTESTIILKSIFHSVLMDANCFHLCLSGGKG